MWTVILRNRSSRGHIKINLIKLFRGSVQINYTLVLLYVDIDKGACQGEQLACSCYAVI